MPKSSALGAQMYTLRDYLKTPADIAKTCARVRKMGYEAIQVSAFGPIEVGELARILQGEGLACAATHVGLDMLKDTSRCVEYHAALQCRYPAIGGFFKDQATQSDYEQFAADFSEAAARLTARGLGAGYHNHSHELIHYGGRPALELLIEHTAQAVPGKPQAVWFEIDTYWIAHGGGDPAAWIEKVQGRIPCVHFKDMAMGADRQQKMAEIGAGNLNWPRILQACKAAGVEWYLVERDNGDLDPFESLQASLNNLRAMGLH